MTAALLQIAARMSAGSRGAAMFLTQAAISARFTAASRAAVPVSATAVIAARSTANSAARAPIGAIAVISGRVTAASRSVANLLSGAITQIYARMMATSAGLFRVFLPSKALGHVVIVSPETRILAIQADVRTLNVSP